MGCCMQREWDKGDYISDENRIQKKPKRNGLFQDGQADDIYMYYRQIKQADQWQETNDLKNPSCKVNFKKGSKYNPDIFIFNVQFTLPVIDFELIKRMLYDYGTRAQWDQSLKSLEVKQDEGSVKIIYSETKIPWPFKDRGFMERFFTHQTDNQLLIVYYSIPFECMKKIEPAHTYIGVNCFEKIGNEIKASTLQQVDMRMQIQKQASKLAVNGFHKWVKSFTDFALKSSY